MQIVTKTQKTANAEATREYFLLLLFLNLKIKNIKLSAVGVLQVSEDAILIHSLRNVVSFGE